MTVPIRNRTLAGVIPAMIVPCNGALFYFVILSGTTIGRTVYAATKVFTLVWPVVAIVAIERQPLSLRPQNLATHIRAIPAGMLSGLVIAFLIVGLYEWSYLGEYVRLHHDAVRDKINSIGLASRGAYLGFSAFMSVLHSLLEEYFWRWYVFGRLSKVTGWPIAYGLASFSFAAHHYVVLGCYFPPLLAATLGTGAAIGACFWCWLYRRQQSLVGVWLSHALADAAIVCIGYRLLFG